MGAIKITRKLLDSIELRDKPYDIWDTDVKGLIVTIFPSGRKTFSFRYYDDNKKKQKIKIGIFGNITCEVAREKAKKIAGDLAHDIDPKKAKQKQENDEKQPLIARDFFELFIEKYIMQKYKPTTIYRSNIQIRKHIIPFFNKKCIGKISKADIIVFIESLSHLQTTANSCFAFLSVAFNQAELWGYREENSNPCRGVKKYPENLKERFLRNEELVKFEQILLEHRYVSKSSPYTLAALWMLLYTGCRENEVLTLQWKDVHLEDGYIYLPNSKVGVRAIPLNNKAKNILSSLQKQENNPYVFCGNIPGQHLKETKTTWRKVRELADISDVRLHDLRHSFASFALKKGVDLYTVSKLLGHKNIKTTTRYAHLELDHLKKATNKVAEIFS